ncbi:flavin reductase family protein [Paraburkholderia sp. J12]|uniref:flavin reductase family protein n=1 Tax=Paraburkholderia sp. J12 TaxID=2805432 RepID=UPI002ABE5BFA|nr:flavin reductase family protein [Paraburkholderia sp. J12]
MNAHGLAAVGLTDVDAPRRDGALAREVATTQRFDERRLRNALGRFATGVVVISTGSGDALHAMTANAFMSGSLRPPLIVVSVGHRARMHERLMQTDRFGVSVLSEEQEPYSRHFAGEPQSWLAPRFTELEGLKNVALVEQAVAHFGLRIVDRYPCGDHTLFVGEIIAFSLDEREPLIFIGGRYASVAGDR